MHDAPPWARFGIGPIFAFPAASHSEMGNQSYQVGPAFGWSNRLIEGWGFALLGQEFLSYAGYRKRKGVNQFPLQLFIVKYLPDAWYVETQPIITIDFEKNTRTIPINFTIGRLLSHRVDVSIQTDTYPDWTNTPKYKRDLRMRADRDHATQLQAGARTGSQSRAARAA